MANRRNNVRDRSDKVRARRKKEQKENRSPVFGNSAAQRKNRPTPVTRRKRTKVQPVNRNRRKVYLPLKTTGAELQLPAFPNLTLGWRLISGVIFVVSLTIVIALSSVNTFQVNTIELEGAQRLSTELVMRELNVKNVSIIEIRPAEIEDTIEEAFPSLSNVRVSVGLPASVTVRVTERQPLVSWQQGESLFWIDAEGVMFTPLGEADVPVKILAEGPPPAAVINPEENISEEIEEESLAALLAAENQIPQTTPEFVQGVLALSDYVPEETALKYDPQFGLGWQDPQGWLVYFGRNTTDITLKLAEYQTIIADLQEKNITPVLISLEFLHAPFYRLEQ